MNAVRVLSRKNCGACKRRNHDHHARTPKHLPLHAARLVLMNSLVETPNQQPPPGRSLLRNIGHCPHVSHLAGSAHCFVDQESQGPERAQTLRQIDLQLAGANLIIFHNVHRDRLQNSRFTNHGRSTLGHDRRCSRQKPHCACPGRTSYGLGGQTCRLGKVCKTPAAA